MAPHRTIFSRNPSSTLLKANHKGQFGHLQLRICTASTSGPAICLIGFVATSSPLPPLVPTRTALVPTCAALVPTCTSSRAILLEERVEILCVSKGEQWRFPKIRPTPGGMDAFVASFDTEHLEGGTLEGQYCVRKAVGKASGLVRLRLEDERRPQHVTEDHTRMKRLSVAVVVILLVLAGRTPVLGSTSSQQGVIGPSAIREATDTSPSNVLDGAVAAYLAGFSGREVVLAATAPRTGGTVGGELRGRGAEVRSRLEISAASLTDVVRQYCVVCHNDGMLTGNLTLSDFDVDRAAERAETAEKMIVKLRAGMMPSPGRPGRVRTRCWRWWRLWRASSTRRRLWIRIRGGERSSG